MDLLTRLFDRIRRPDWSPYLGGVVLGLVVAASMGAFGHRLSGAGAYQDLSGVIGKQVAPHSVVIGAIAGAFYDRVMPVFARAAHAGTLPELFHIDPWLAVVLFAEIALLGFYVLEHGHRERVRP